jgi:hypothetical protein
VGISLELFDEMAFLGQDPGRCKIVVHHKCLQELKNFKRLGCEVSCESETDVQQKVTKFAQIPGVLKIMLIYRPTGR